MQHSSASEPESAESSDICDSADTMITITEEANSDNYLAEEVREVASTDCSDIDVDVVADVSDMPESIVVCYAMHVYFCHGLYNLYRLTAAMVRCYRIQVDHSTTSL